MTETSTSSRKNYLISLAILAGMFFLFGAISWVNPILIPCFRICCELGHFTKIGSPLPIMGLCGNAILPLIYGWMAQHIWADTSMETVSK